MTAVANSNPVDAATDRFTKVSEDNQVKQLNIATNSSNSAVTTALTEQQVKLNNKLAEVGQAVKM